MLGLVALSACILGTDPQADLVLSMQLSTTHVRADSGLVIRLTAYNPTDHSIQYAPCPQLLSVALVPPDTTLLPFGGPFMGSEQGCFVLLEKANIGLDSGLTLRDSIPAGDSLSSTWTLYFESRPGPRWPAGKYTVRGLMQVPSSPKTGARPMVAKEVDSTFTLACRFETWTRC